MIHKETFHQSADSGIPAHWVVQYYQNAFSSFPEAAYFSTLKEAEEFEDNIRCESQQSQPISK